MNIIPKVKKELKKHIEPKYRKTSYGFFKEEINILGVRVPTARKIGKQLYKEIAHLEKEEVFDLVEQLLKTHIYEHFIVGFEWAYKQKPNYTKRDLKIFKHWIDKYCTNWAAIDDLCTRTMKDFLLKFPNQGKQLLKWTKSKNRWTRRAALSSMVYPSKEKHFLNLALQLSDAVMDDKDDLVNKPQGWMLREAHKAHPKEIEAYVLKNKNNFARVTLRYAIERYPTPLKKKAME
ncbi:MAG: DNA alkylation repair protein [Candidatus Nanoarchaeia archaeon]